MKTLFLISSALFVMSGLGWFFVWAIWIHAEEAWHGRAAGPLAQAEHAPSFHSPEVRHLAWYGRLKIATIVLFAVSLALLVGWHYSP